MNETTYFQDRVEELLKIGTTDETYEPILFGFCFLEFFLFVLSGYFLGNKNDYVAFSLLFISAFFTALITGRIISYRATRKMKGGIQKDGMDKERQ